jgi:signal transduction histidine kinase
MLEKFIRTNRDAIIERARARVAARTAPTPTDVELANGVPVFLDQLGDALHLAKSSDNVDHEQLRNTASRHGRDLLRLGLTVAQVVRDYGDVCQSITELATEQSIPIPPDEFRTLNLCLDDAIAEAVTEYTRERDSVIETQGTERLGILAHEQRNLLNTAMLAFENIKSGRVAARGSTGNVLDRSLIGLRDLIDRAFADVRLDAGIGRLDSLCVAQLVEEVEVGAFLQAQARGHRFAVTTLDRTVTIEGDSQVLTAALSNLLQNAFKFTPAHGHVSLTARASADEVFFDVEDECGGLPPGKPEDLFRSFEQHSADRSGLGLGLSICLKAANANGGHLSVRDLPGEGCVFTIALPRKPPPPLTLVASPDAVIAVPGATDAKLGPIASSGNDLG